MQTTQNHVIELTFESTKRYEDPFNEIQLRVLITGPDNKHRSVPAFWAGERTWRVRYSSNLVGRHAYSTECSDIDNRDLHGNSGTIDVMPYEGHNDLYKHGPVTRCHSRAYLEHLDGKPFYWLADTWWMGLCRRLPWPEGFQTLVEDRVTKGFSVIQIVAGLYPDMEPFDERGANQAGFPWDPEFRHVNPAYFDRADLKIGCLVEAGLVPCIVGCWGYYLDLFGTDAVKKHWDYLIARYGAYPVVWCLAGEAVMPYYLNEAFRNLEKRREYEKRLRREWTVLTRYVKSSDPFERPLTIHPTRFGHEMVEDPSLLDINMLQTGHESFSSLRPTVVMVKTAVKQTPKLPVLNSEVCYEGIRGSSHSDVQRFLFWACALNGTCGHTYGANGIWQVNTREHPYGASPHGTSWGDTPWDLAYRLPGSQQAGIMKKLLERYRWWEFRTHPEWIELENEAEKELGPFAAGIPGEVRVIFISALTNMGRYGIKVRAIEIGSRYRAYYYDPIKGDEYDLGDVAPDRVTSDRVTLDRVTLDRVALDRNGSWQSGTIPIFQDWVLVLENYR